jgi:hypothetical protein
MSHCVAVYDLAVMLRYLSKKRERMMASDIAASRTALEPPDVCLVLFASSGSSRSLFQPISSRFVQELHTISGVYLMELEEHFRSRLVRTVAPNDGSILTAKKLFALVLNELGRLVCESRLLQATHQESASRS